MHGVCPDKWPEMGSQQVRCEDEGRKALPVPARRWAGEVSYARWHLDRTENTRGAAQGW